MATRRNAAGLKGAPAQGSRPRGNGAVVPNAQYPTVLGTGPGPEKADVSRHAVPGGGEGVTVNANPAGRGSRRSRR